jgi:hypothetical protein
MAHPYAVMDLYGIISNEEDLGLKDALQDSFRIAIMPNPFPNFSIEK